MEQKPKYFDLIAWSWFGMSALGLALSLLSVISIPEFNRAKDMILPSYSGIHPQLGNAMSMIFKWMLPASLIQLALAGVATYASWKFIKRQEWARYALMTINYFFMVLTVATYAGVIWFVRTIYEIMGVVGDVVLNSAAPGYFHPLGLLLTCLCVAPLILMAWYFHWKPVREYFRS